jgi:hypothetical protein
MQRAYYSGSIPDFLATTPNEILGTLLANTGGSATEHTQRDAWVEQINILKRVIANRSGRIYFEYAILHMGKRIDVVLLGGPVISVLEFKVGKSHFTSSVLDQVTDYCLDLKVSTSRALLQSTVRNNLVRTFSIISETLPNTVVGGIRKER